MHPKAIYLHQGQQYHVERLDFEQRKAYVKRVNVDYYTDAIRYTQVRVLEIAEEERIAGPAARAHGDVLVRSQVVGFKKIKFFTNENVGAGKLELPENEMHTTAFWITLERELLAELAVRAVRPAERNFRAAVRAGIDGHAAADVRPARSGDGGRRAAAEPGRRNRVGQEFSRRIDGCGGDEGILRAESVLVRRVSGRDRIQRAALSRARICCCGGRAS